MTETKVIDETKSMLGDRYRRAFLFTLVALMQLSPWPVGCGGACKSIHLYGAYRQQRRVTAYPSQTAGQESETADNAAAVHQKRRSRRSSYRHSGCKASA